MSDEEQNNNVQANGEEQVYTAHIAATSFEFEKIFGDTSGRIAN